MMKPWQTPLHKAPSKGGKKRNKERGPKLEPEQQNPKWVTKGQRNKSCFRLYIVLTQPQPKLQVRNQPYGPSLWCGNSSLDIHASVMVCIQLTYSPFSLYIHNLRSMCTRKVLSSICINQMTNEICKTKKEPLNLTAPKAGYAPITGLTWPITCKWTRHYHASPR